MDGKNNGTDKCRTHKGKKLMLGVCTLVFLGVLLTGCFALGYKGVGAPGPTVPGKKYAVLVDKSDHKLYLKDGDTVVRTWGCAIGKGGLGQKERRGDNMTPVGTFRIDEIDDASGWTHDFGDGNGEIQGAYGPWFLSLDTEDLSQGNWDGIGIHGTHDPASIGTDASEGCVRLDNANLRELEKVAYVGMPVTIQD